MVTITSGLAAIGGDSATGVLADGPQLESSVAEAITA
jgi:hypothetical protein